VKGRVPGTPLRVLRYALALNLVLAFLGVGGAALFVLRRRGEAPRLELRDAGSGRLYRRWPLREGETFSVEFLHSVNQSPVRETFSAEGREIRLRSVRFYSFGAGMQSDLEEGQVLERDGEALIIRGYRRGFPALGYILGAPSDHLLSIGGETLSLRELCGENARISFRLR
jgi:hypothetical protein